MSSTCFEYHAFIMRKTTCTYNSVRYVLHIYYWLTIHNCIKLHGTINIQLTANIKSYLIIWHHSVYCLHPSVLHEERRNRGVRYLAQNYFMITIVYKFHKYRNNKRWSLIQHISHCQLQVFLQRNDFNFLYCTFTW